LLEGGRTTDLIRKGKKTNFIIIIGLSLIAFASIFWLFTINAIRSQEIMLATQDLGMRMSFHEEALQWLKNVYATTVIPVTGILTLLGLAAVIGPLLHGLTQHFVLRKSALTVIEEKAVPIWDDTEGEPVVVMRELISEEANLMEEMKKLESFREKWELKVKKDIETKRKSIKKLRSEIANLKFMREELLKSSKMRTKVRYNTP
jgi:hypothetical protein